MFGDGDAQLVERGPDLGIDLVETGELRSGRGSRPVVHVLEVDRRVVQVGPGGLLQREEVAQRPEPPFEQPRRLALLGRDQGDDVLVETLRRQLGLQVAVEPVGILSLDEFLDQAGALDRLGSLDQLGQRVSRVQSAILL